MSATGSRREAGFTLIETLTVLAITTTISLLAFPSMERAMGAVALTQARQAVMADLRRARAQALSGGAIEVLAVRPDGRGYGWTHGLGDTLPPMVRLQGPQAAIAFFPDGSAMPGRLTLVGGSRASVITVAPTGAVFVEPAVEGGA